MSRKNDVSYYVGGMYKKIMATKNLSGLIMLDVKDVENGECIQNHESDDILITLNLDFDIPIPELKHAWFNSKKSGKRGGFTIKTIEAKHLIKHLYNAYSDFVCDKDPDLLETFEEALKKNKLFVNAPKKAKMTFRRDVSAGFLIQSLIKDNFGVHYLLSFHQSIVKDPKYIALFNNGKKKKQKVNKHNKNDNNNNNNPNNDDSKDDSDDNVNPNKREIDFENNNNNNNNNNSASNNTGNVNNVNMPIDDEQLLKYFSEKISNWSEARQYTHKLQWGKSKHKQMVKFVDEVAWLYCTLFKEIENNIDEV